MLHFVMSMLLFTYICVNSTLSIFFRISLSPFLLFHWTVSAYLIWVIQTKPAARLGERLSKETAARIKIDQNSLSCEQIEPHISDFLDLRRYLGELRGGQMVIQTD